MVRSVQRPRIARRKAAGGVPTCAAHSKLPKECGKSNEKICFFVQDFCELPRSPMEPPQPLEPTPEQKLEPIERQPMRLIPDIDTLPEPTSSVCLCGFPELHCEVSEWSGSGKTCETSTDCPSEGCGGMVTCGAPPHL